MQQGPFTCFSLRRGSAKRRLSALKLPHAGFELDRTAWSVRIFAVNPDLAQRSIMGLAAFAVLMATECGAASFIFD
jgi:hypothetical protein